MQEFLVLKPGYSFVDFSKEDRRVVAHRPEDPKKRGKDEEYLYPAADPRITAKNLHVFFPYGNPDAGASAHREADEMLGGAGPMAGDQTEPDDVEEAEDDEAEADPDDDPLAALGD